MKVFFASPFFLGLLLAAAASASILTEPKHPQDARWLKISDDVSALLDKEIQAKANGLTININKESCPDYNPKDPATRLSVCIQKVNDAENSITIQFRSPNNHFELEFSNIDVNDAASDIKVEPYFQEYLDSLKDLALTDADRKTSIKEGITAAGGALSIGDLAISDTDNKITYTYQGKPNTVSFKINGDLLEFSTDFFQDSIDLNIPLKRFIVFEVKKMFREIVDHLYQMQRFALSDGESAAQSIKVLTCDKLMGDTEMQTAFADRLTKNGLANAVAGTVFTITKDGDTKSVTVTCASEAVGDFNLLVVKADFTAVSPKIQPLQQTYLEKSLYNLLPVNAAFFSDLATFVIRILADKNVEEEFEPLTVETSG